MRLNKASLDVWYKLFEDKKYQDISERIIFLDGVEELTADQLAEKETFIKLEKKFLKEAQASIDGERLVIQSVNVFRQKLDGDEILETVFNDRVMLRFLNNELLSPEDVEALYTDLREEYVDLKGHDNIIEEYNCISKSDNPIPIDEFELVDDMICSNPDCLYCPDVTLEEHDQAFDNLVKGGYLVNNIQEGLMDLMVKNMRLLTIISEYIDISCDFEDDDDDDDEEII